MPDGKAYAGQLISAVRLVEQVPGAIPRIIDLTNWTCTCEGYVHRQKCKHVTKFRDMLDNLQEE